MPARFRKSTHALLLLATVAVIPVAALIDAGHSEPGPDEVVMRHQVANWGLTDLALFTEARYTRHPSQADRHAAFQDHPGALEHFPTGALMPPPPHLAEATPP
jgi:hypothetical protein